MTVTKCPHCSGLVTVKLELAKAVAQPGAPSPGISAPAASAAQPKSAPSGLVPVSALVTCQRCGQDDLAWQKSTKTGKNYLCLGVIKDGRAYASRREFHQCQARGSWPNTQYS